MPKLFSFFLLLVFTLSAAAQKLSKSDKLSVQNIRSHVSFLADDKLEGRRTGTEGEKLAYEYISNEFEMAGLKAKGDKGTYIQAFEVNEGKQIDPSTHLTINGTSLLIDKDYYPFAFSAKVEK